jgi:NAD(P)-dependent dehydrogenase (short-subunit alcohol dehydrogenase family)
MLEDRTVAISGAASGIGRAAAEVFAGYGAKVLLIDRRDDVCALAKRIDRAEGHVVDVSDPKAVQAFFSGAGSAIDGAFNNAGIEGGDGSMVPLSEATVEVFDEVFAVNARGMFLALRAQMNLMLGRGGGSIVNTSSVMGLGGTPGMATYAASKHAVLGLTRSAALEGAPGRRAGECRLSGCRRDAHVARARLCQEPGFCRDGPAGAPDGPYRRA